MSVCFAHELCPDLVRREPLGQRVSDAWEDIDLTEVQRSFKGRRDVYDEIEYWVREKKWRVRVQGHKYALYPPDPGVRIVPPWVRVDGTAKCDAKWQAKTIRRDCRKLERAIEEQNDGS